MLAEAGSRLRGGALPKSRRCRLENHSDGRGHPGRRSERIGGSAAQVRESPGPLGHRAADSAGQRLGRRIPERIEFIIGRAAMINGLEPLHSLFEQRGRDHAGGDGVAIRGGIGDGSPLHLQNLVAADFASSAHYPVVIARFKHGQSRKPVHPEGEHRRQNEKQCQFHE